MMRYRDRSTDPWKVVQGEVLEVNGDFRTHTVERMLQIQ